MNHYSKIYRSLVWMALLSFGVLQRMVPFAQAEETLPAPASSAVLSMDGPGGRVSLGDDLALAKKAFPARKGAEIYAPMNVGVSGEWRWTAFKPFELFRAESTRGKVTGLTRTLIVASEGSREKQTELMLARLGPPTAQVSGKVTTVYAWDAKPHVRFLIVAKRGIFHEGPMVVTMIGDREELKGEGYPADDLKAVIKEVEGPVVKAAEEAAQYRAYAAAEKHSRQRWSKKAQAAASVKDPFYQAIVSMDGPGGRLTLGDRLGQAMKSFPRPQGAFGPPVGITEYPSFGDDSWGWSMEKSDFGVQLIEGQRVDAMYRRVRPTDDKALDQLIALNLQKLGPPVAQAVGKTVAMYIWEAKPHMRLLTVQREEYTREAPMAVATIGAPEAFKLIGYSKDSIAVLVQALDKEAAERPTTEMAPAILCMDGPGGRLALGDSLGQAKKAFPARKGAWIGGPSAFATVFDRDGRDVNGNIVRDGWTWITQVPRELFEVSVHKGRVLGIQRFVGMLTRKSHENLMRDTIGKLGQPDSLVRGKTVVIYAWVLKPNARVVFEYKNGDGSGLSSLRTVIGHQEDLETLGIDVDDLKSSADSIDLFEAAKKAANTKPPESAKN